MSGRHLLDAAVLLHQLQRFLRADPFDAIVEVGADQQRKVDEPLAVDLPAVKQPCEFDRLRHDRAERALARQELLSRDGEKPHQPRRAKEQRIVVLAGCSPHSGEVAAM